jgi:hypothetical protein
MITQIRFERLGSNTKLPIIQIVGNDLWQVVRVIETEATKEGINPAMLNFRWDPAGDGKNYLIRHATNSVIGVFTIMNVGSK